jgi:hypothetical protein
MARPACVLLRSGGLPLTARVPTTSDAPSDGYAWWNLSPEVFTRRSTPCPARPGVGPPIRHGSGARHPSRVCYGSSGETSSSISRSTAQAASSVTPAVERGLPQGVLGEDARVTGLRRAGIRGLLLAVRVLLIGQPVTVVVDAAAAGLAPRRALGVVAVVVLALRDVVLRMAVIGVTRRILVASSSCCSRA